MPEKVTTQGFALGLLVPGIRFALQGSISTQVTQGTCSYTLLVMNLFSPEKYALSKYFCAMNNHYKSCLFPLFQKRCKDGTREQTKRATCKENGKERTVFMEAASVEPQPDSAVESPKDKQKSSNPKRAPGRDESSGGKNSVSPGLPSGPCAKRAVHVKANLSEEKGSSSNVAISKKVSSQRNDRGAQGDAPLDLKVRNREKGWHMF